MLCWAMRVLRRICAPSSITAALRNRLRGLSLRRGALHALPHAVPVCALALSVLQPPKREDPACIDTLLWGRWAFRASLPAELGTV